MDYDIIAKRPTCAFIYVDQKFCGHRFHANNPHVQTDWTHEFIEMHAQILYKEHTPKNIFIKLQHHFIKCDLCCMRQKIQ